MLLLSGCASTVTKGKAFPLMYDEKPITVLVIPAINHSTAADAPILYSSTINEPLSNAGFYVLPMEITDRFLRNEGLTDGEQFKDIPPQKFSEIFGADTVFYATIEKWETSYYVIGGHVSVGVDFRMKSTKTGETLWNFKETLRVDTGSGNSGFLLLDLVVTAAQTAIQDYVPIARKVNLIAMNAMPFGKYHNQHGKDQETTIPKTKIQE